MKRSPIVIIDDNVTMLHSLEDILSINDYDVYLCKTINEAKERLVYDVPIMIICDINLPDGNGIDFIHELKTNESLSEVPCMLITGDLARATFRRSMLNGADDYITKPFSPTEILESIEHLIKISSKRSRLKVQVNEKLKEINHINSHELRHGVSSLQGIMALVESQDIDISECGSYFTTINQELEEGIQRLNKLLNNEE